MLNRLPGLLEGKNLQGGEILGRLQPAIRYSPGAISKASPFSHTNIFHHPKIRGCPSVGQRRLIILRLEKIQRDFLWGGGALENKPHLVKWSSICRAKEKGGPVFVHSLWWIKLWPCASEGGLLWTKVIKGKYGEKEGGWRSCGVRDPFGVGLWKVISKEWDLFNSKICYEDGKRVKF